MVLSDFLGQHGCKVNVKKLQKLCRERGIRAPADSLEKLKTMRLGKFMDEWHIQGHWRPDLIAFLYACVDAMVGLTDNDADNCIQMRVEWGYDFSIRFSQTKDGRKVGLEYVPMQWLDAEFTRDGRVIYL